MPQSLCNPQGRGEGAAVGIVDAAASHTVGLCVPMTAADPETVASI